VTTQTSLPSRPAGHRDVEAGSVDRPVHEDERVVDGAALAGHRRRGVAEGDRLGDVLGRQGHSPSIVVEHRDGAVGLDALDHPPVTVLDRDAGVGGETALVAAGLGLVADHRRCAVGEGRSLDGLDDLVGVDA